MDWIDLKNEKPNDNEMIMVWQENLNDKKSSRFQRALYNKYGDYESFTIYPLLYKEEFLSSNDFKGYDFEGDLCQITHFTRVKKPNN